jgi:DNA-binding MurR/RpiR family transcriptional regulator
MLASRIQKHFPSLTGQQKKIAGQILSLGHEAAFFTISRLARQFKTSESTIVRFARALGYKGYPDMQKDLQDGIRQKLSPPEAFQHSMAKVKEADLYSKIFEQDLENLTKTRELNSNQAIDRVVQEILRARKVGITGFRSSHPLANLLYLLLGQVRKNCELLEFSLGSLPNQIIHYGPEDLLIATSLLRYSRQTLASLQYAKKNRCRTIGVTDSPISPIGQIADIVLLVESQSSTYFNSLASAITLMNCLVAGVSLKNKNSLETLKMVNKVMSDWRYHLM